MNKETNDLLESIVNAHGMGALKDWQKHWPANYNVAPTNEVPVAASHNGSRSIESVRWGMVAPYAKEFGGKPTFNARIETVATNGMFKKPFLEHRVVVPALGYYEWQERADGKQPYFIRMLAVVIVDELVPRELLRGELDLDELDHIALHSDAVDLVILERHRASVAEPLVPASEVTGGYGGDGELVAGGLPVEVGGGPPDRCVGGPHDLALLVSEPLAVGQPQVDHARNPSLRDAPTCRSTEAVEGS